MTLLLSLTLIIGIFLLCIAALHDIAARTVPNRLAAAVAAVGVVAQALQGTLVIALPTALGVFVLAALLWRRGWMGGGDVKLLGAAALLVPPWGVPAMIVGTALSGGVLALPYLVARHRLPCRPSPKPILLLTRALRVERWRLRRGGPMPYAVAIASGAFIVLARGALP